MKPEGQLQISAGVISECGKRADNQDFAGVYTGTAIQRVSHGLVAALADGVSGAKSGRIAAELAVRTLIDGLYEQPDTIGAAAAAQRVMAPYNRWLAAMGKSDSMTHAATTFTALVVKGRRAHVLHVGAGASHVLHVGAASQPQDDDFYSAYYRILPYQVFADPNRGHAAPVCARHQY